MGDYDPTAAAILGALTAAIVAYGLYLKFSIRRLDRIIAEKEAALNAAEQPAAAPR